MTHPLVADRRSLALYLTAWLLVGLALGLPAVGAQLDSWRTASLSFLPPFLLFALLCLGAWYPCRANPLGSTSAWRLAAVHLSAALAWSLAWWAAARGWNAWLERLRPEAAFERFAPDGPRVLALGVLLYLLVATLAYLLLAFDESRQARERALELRVLAREAELSAFKSQIDPHFLFNCLNSISSLCGSDPRAAREMAIRLGEFLRATLRLTERQTISLRDELALAEGFLAIERTRFGERLAVESEIDPGALDCEVPALLLQPLLENAVKHGLADLVDGGRIDIRATTGDGRLEIEITNPRDTDSIAGGDGIGLANVAGRLDLLYPGDARLEVEPSDDGFRVLVDLPARHTRLEGGAR